MGPVATSTLITVAPTGAETAKSDAPALPVTLDELVSTAKACQAAGAGLIHIHIRDAEARPTLDVGRLTATVEAVREATDLVVQLSTGGAVTDPYSARLAVLEAAPDSCSLTCGTVNFGSDVFMNPWDFIVELYRETQAPRDRPRVRALRPRPRHRPEPPARQGGPAVRRQGPLRPRPRGARRGAGHHGVRRDHGLAAARGRLLVGHGRRALHPARWPSPRCPPGGHLRVGMEDTLTFEPGRPVRDNAELVERAATLATLALRPPMTTDEARALLNVKDRRNGVGA